MRIESLKRAALAGLMLVVVSATASAGPIQGTFAIAGLFRGVDAAGAEVLDADGNPTLAGATGIDFFNLDGQNPADATGEFMVVSTFSKPGQVNNFAPLLWQRGTIHDLMFNADAIDGFPTVPILGFESLSIGGGLRFDLEKLYVKYQDDHTLTLSGGGMFYWAGYDPTPGAFEFTGTNSGGSMAFVASEAAPVPEPASIVLMGSGALAGLNKLRRRRKAVAA